MAGPSYSAWFLRFVTAFDSPGRVPDTADASHQEWLKVFVEAFRGESTSAAEAHDAQWDFDLRDEVDLEVEPESQAEPHRAQEQPRTQERKKYMQSGGDDVEW